MVKKHLITVAYGDGIGPEIMEATLRILEAAGAAIEIDKVEIGEKVYLAGNPVGMEEKTWESLEASQVFLKAPITTPQGGGYKSLNVAIRSNLGLYANVRPCISYHPYIQTKHPQMDLVVIRENEEDLYVGIEYRQTPDTTEALKLITRPGTERICRFAFEYARARGRKKVSCFTKDNILKITDGLFHQVFEEIGNEYSTIEKEHMIIDIGMAKVADTPEAFDIIVLPNLYGDILSDVTAQITGSVGLVGTANIGEKGAMFEAIHGSAMKRAGQDIANPSGLLLAGVLLLLHIHQAEVATRIHNAFLKTIEDGIHTKDIFREGVSKKLVGTKAFTEAIIARLGKQPEHLKAVNYEKIEHKIAHPAIALSPSKVTQRALIGADLYIYSTVSVEVLQKKLFELSTPSLKLVAISNRGVRVWPKNVIGQSLIDLFRCRFLGNNNISTQAVGSLLHRLGTAGLEVTKAENLYTYDGKRGFSEI